MSYKDLEIWQLARELVVDLHQLSIQHLETLFETGSLKEEYLYIELHERLDCLGRKLNLFLQSVARSHRSLK